MRRGRKRKLIIEKISKPREPEDLYVPRGYHDAIPRAFMNFEPYMRNRFNIELENDHLNLFIDTYRIQGFNVEDSNGEKILIVDALLDVNDWIDEFCKMRIARISFLNGAGRETIFFDYDIEAIGHNFGGHYSSDKILTPSITYRIFD